jgi:hypothetical protein
MQGGDSSSQHPPIKIMGSVEAAAREAVVEVSGFSASGYEESTSYRMRYSRAPIILWG